MSVIKNKYPQLTRTGCCMYAAASFFDDREFIDLYQKMPKRYGEIMSLDIENESLYSLEQHRHLAIYRLAQMPFESNNGLNVSQLLEIIFVITEACPETNHEITWLCFPLVVGSSRPGYSHRMYIAVKVDTIKREPIEYVILNPQLHFFPVLTSEGELAQYFELRKTTIYQIDSFGQHGQPSQVFFNPEWFEHLENRREEGYRLED